MEDTYVRLINCRLHIFLSSASSFSSQYLLLFLKSSRSCVLLLLLTHFTSVIFPSMASWRRQFLLKICQIKLAFLLRILFRSVFSAVCSKISSLITFSGHFIVSILLQHHLKLSKYFYSNFLSVHVSEPHNIMLQIKHLANIILNSMFSLLVNSNNFLC